MKIAFENTVIDHEVPRAHGPSCEIEPETHEMIIMNLGINKVSISYYNGSWHIETNTNVKVIVDKPNEKNINCN